FSGTVPKEAARLAGPRKRRSRWDTSDRRPRKAAVPPATQRLEEGEPWGTDDPVSACLRGPARRQQTPPPPHSHPPPLPHPTHTPAVGNTAPPRGAASPPPGRPPRPHSRAKAGRAAAARAALWLTQRIRLPQPFTSFPPGWKWCRVAVRREEHDRVSGQGIT